MTAKKIINTKTSNQKGGITAGIINISDPKKNGSRWSKKSYIVTLLIAVLAILTFFDLDNMLMKKDSSDKNQEIYNTQSVNQSGGITAGKVEIFPDNKPSDRHINDSVKEQIDNMLKKYSGSETRIHFAAGNAEAQTFAQEITDYLLSKGLDTEGPLSSMFFGTSTEEYSMFIRKDGKLIFEIKNNTR